MVPGIILAAGASSRMGTPKALLRVGGATFLGRLITTLREAGVPEILVVLGHEAGRIRESIGPLPPQIRLLENRDYQRGQLSSLLLALDAADRPGVVGLLVTLVDTPLVSPRTVEAIRAAHRPGGAAIIRPASRGRHGHPVLFDRRVFTELRGADPAAGAKAVVHAHAADILEIEVEDEGAFIDIDTPEDYQRFIGSCSDT